MIRNQNDLSYKTSILLDFNHGHSLEGLLASYELILSDSDTNISLPGDTGNVSYCITRGYIKDLMYGIPFPRKYGYSLNKQKL